ncbi:hypothetical protein CAPTEDRAFT_215212 [Capitella teleta]|uniref:Sulfotransferase domain-containing protein n=1 Tax=Capitella teleta TaxID=283909 RepID=R7VFP2_CAPTE|nr:hypothetical protein CAPTEDRAFT_215212 [Capitella teleta]|eukprot:ELU17439.1 hypothetical protein CAPTEDRAFT_215212 [Capitella teleta]
MNAWKRSVKFGFFSAVVVLGLIANFGFNLEILSTKLARFTDFKPVQTSINASKKILLVTYFRGGSTLLGELFNQYPNSFYWFEPLEVIESSIDGFWQEINSPESSFDVFDSTINQRSHKLYKSFEVAHQVIRSILYCNVSSINEQVLTFKIGNFFTKSKSLPVFAKCASRQTEVSKIKYDDWIDTKYIKGCGRFIKYPCQNAIMRVIKTIRVPLAYTIDLIRSDPTLKVVYSIRNPLAMFNSARELYHYGPEDISNFCKRMNIDWMTAKWLQKEYPDNIHIVKYEELALNTSSVATKVYEYIGIEIPREFTGSEPTSLAYGERSDRFSTNKNSTEAVIHWKETMHPAAVKLVINQCHDIIKAMGYTDDIPSKFMSNFK